MQVGLVPYPGHVVLVHRGGAVCPSPLLEIYGGVSQMQPGGSHRQRLKLGSGSLIARIVGGCVNPLSRAYGSNSQGLSYLLFPIIRNWNLDRLVARGFLEHFGLLASSEVVFILCP